MMHNFKKFSKENTELPRERRYYLDIQIIVEKLKMENDYLLIGSSFWKYDYNIWYIYIFKNEIERIYVQNHKMRTEKKNIK